MIVDFFQSLFGSIWPIILLLAIAAVTGFIAQAVVGKHRGGCLASIGIGFIGALLGIWLAGVLGLPELYSINAGGVNFPIVWAILGAMLLLLLLRAARR
jgi:uncharacterized membrane protein YeaQ/YmgE (transglycosylase-associated protein family)